MTRANRAHSNVSLVPVPLRVEEGDDGCVSERQLNHRKTRNHA